jgi:sRNA-binding regulator protein Hfq
MDGSHGPAQVDAPAQPQRKPIPDFYRRWLKKTVKIKCISGAVIEGILAAYSPYDMIIEIAGGEEILVPKHAALFISCPKPAPVAV